MDRSQAIGIALLFGLFYLVMVYNAPSEEEQAAMQQRQDSLNALQTPPPSEDEEVAPIALPKDTVSQDTTVPQIKEEVYTLENDVMILRFSNRGGKIIGAELKNHYQVLMDEEKNKTKVPLSMMDNPDNSFDYVVRGVNQATLSTNDHIFSADVSGNTISFEGNINGQAFIQKYTLRPNEYTVDINVKAPGILGKTSSDDLILRWKNHLNKLELNVQYEKYYSTVYFKEGSDNPDYCSCRGDDNEVIDEKNIAWISHANQFFNSALIPQGGFTSGDLKTIMPEDEDGETLKLIDTKVTLPLEQVSSEGIAMQMYIGPNDFEILRAFGNDLEDVVPFGSSIFGTVNRWIIRPLFNFLQSWFASAGLVILLLTIIVKLALYPLTYRMLKSQTKMASLKPEIEKLKNKYKDDSSQQQMETMKLYREYGVSPLGGCMPMLLQMPIWFALYRFFPASIEFRQAPFLWADDLSSFDVIAYLPFEIPMFGAHISLFTILWVLTTLLYTYYNSKIVDMSANPAMKYMQYGMPVMFLFFFNNYASGLTAYLMFSNIFNIGQTLITKNVILDQDKIREGLEINKNKPKKKGGFQERLEKALKEQQKVQAERQKKKK